MQEEKPLLNLSKEAFSAYIESALQPKLEYLEGKRKEVISVAIKYGAIGVTVAVAIIIGSYAKLEPEVAKVISIFAGVGGLISLAPAIRKWTQVVEMYKREIITKMVKFINPEVKYSPKGFISRNEFTNSQIYLNKITDYKGEDLVQGKLDKTSFSFSEIKATKVTSSGSGKDKKTKREVVFDGLFFVADFNKHFAGQTFVLTDSSEKLFGSLAKTFQKANFSRPKLVKLENVEFEKEFKVYGSNENETRYILTPKIMESIVDLRRKTGQIQLSFVSSNVYVAIPIRRNLFEPKFFKSFLDTEPIEYYFSVMGNAISIVQELDLNTRIWTKD